MPDDRHDEHHEGGYVWRNGAEMEWECAEFCPHPSHDDGDADDG